jgi:CRISPR-associated protein Csm3
MVFEKLEQMVEIHIEYEVKSSLAIRAGTEEGLAAVEQPVVKVGGVPVLPGSSLKGALRSLLESLLSQSGVKVCIPRVVIPQEHSRPPEEMKRYVEKMGRRLPCVAENLCPVCQIFGSEGVSSRATFLDARPISKIEILERKHVAIARDTKTAARGALLEIETIEPGAKFAGTIRVINPEKWHIGALLASIENLSYLGMGSKKSGGYGELETTIKRVTTKLMEEGTWIEKHIEPEEFKEAFLEYLREGK